MQTERSYREETPSLRLLPAPQTAPKVRRQLKRYHPLWHKLNLKIGFHLDPHLLHPCYLIRRQCMREWFNKWVRNLPKRVFKLPSRPLTHDVTPAASPTHSLRVASHTVSFSSDIIFEGMTWFDWSEPTSDECIYPPRLFSFTQLWRFFFVVVSLSHN